MNILSHFYYKVLILIQVPETYFPHMLHVFNVVSVLWLLREPGSKTSSLLINPELPYQTCSSENPNNFI